MVRFISFLFCTLISASICLAVEPTSFALVVERVLPSVVGIEAVGDKTNIGSGFVTGGEGYILTSAHVIADADQITLSFSNGNTVKAFVVGKDARMDVALLKSVTPLALTPIAWETGPVRMGDWCLAMGNPYDLGTVVSAGIVSAKSDQLIQTDALINQGNSGGPLFNANGNVIGMNTAMYANEGKTIGLNAAIPAAALITIERKLRNGSGTALSAATAAESESDRVYMELEALHAD